MSVFRLGVDRKLNKYVVLRALPIVFLVVVLLTQVERFMHQGTLLGYRVRTVTSKKSQQVSNQSGSLFNAQVSAKNSKSIACDTFPEKEVSKVLGDDIVRISGFLPDKTEPNLVSTCIYRAKDEASKTAALLVRDMKDDVVASKTVESISKAKQIEKVDDLGDEAIFNASANQLTVRTGKRLLTITVTASTDKKMDNKSTAISIAKIGL